MNTLDTMGSDVFITLQITCLVNYSLKQCECVWIASMRVSLLLNIYGFDWISQETCKEAAHYVDVEHHGMESFRS